MGQVYRAEDLNLKRIVALKFLSRETLGEEDIKAEGLIRALHADVARNHLWIGTGHGLKRLDVRTGELRWHHQITPHDIWGYDLATPPVLIDVRNGSGTVKGLAQASKSGWMYLFDRETGEVIRRSEPFVPQSNLFKRPKDAGGIVVSPGGGGGANWPPASFSPETGWLYVAANHYPSLYTLERDERGHDHVVLGFPEDVETYGTVAVFEDLYGNLWDLFQPA